MQVSLELCRKGQSPSVPVDKFAFDAKAYIEDVPLEERLSPPNSEQHALRLAGSITKVLTGLTQSCPRCGGVNVIIEIHDLSRMSVQIMADDGHYEQAVDYVRELIAKIEQMDASYQPTAPVEQSAA